MRWLRLVGSLKLYVSFAKEPYKRDDILQTRPIFWRGLLTVANPNAEDDGKEEEKDKEKLQKCVCFSFAKEPYFSCASFDRALTRKTHIHDRHNMVGKKVDEKNRSNIRDRIASHTHNTPHQPTNPPTHPHMYTYVHIHHMHNMVGKKGGGKQSRSNIPGNTVIHTHTHMYTHTHVYGMHQTVERKRKDDQAHKTFPYSSFLYVCVWVFVCVCSNMST